MRTLFPLYQVQAEEVWCHDRIEPCQHKYCGISARLVLPDRLKKGLANPDM